MSLIRTNFLPGNRLTRTAIGSAIILSALLLLLPQIVKLDGTPHADWQQFVGRFHPLMVHLPIGFLLLVPVLEVGGRWKSALRESAGFVLWLTLVSSLGVMALGYLLAYGSGASGTSVTRHMWGGIWLCIGVMLSLVARPLWINGSVRWFYPALLTLVLLEMSWTAHQGGLLTHGSNYLTKYMPAGWSRGNSSHSLASAPDSFYTKQIDPIFDAKCVTCHGSSKVEGRLRLDSYDRVMRGGKDGVVVRPGEPDTSLLLVRVTLPASHKQFMPAEGKPPLKPEEIALIRAWIKQGASPTATALTGVVIQELKEVPIQPVADYSALIPEIQQMDKGTGAKLVQVSSKPSDGLILRTNDAGKTFGDAQLAQFLKYAPYIVELELTRTSITDASFDTIAKFTHLRMLHLDDTSVTGDGLAKLNSLSQLSYLNLSGTRVTALAIVPLQLMKNLHRIYLYDTPAQPVTDNVPATTQETHTQ